MLIKLALQLIAGALTVQRLFLRLSARYGEKLIWQMFTVETHELIEAEHYFQRKFQLQVELVQQFTSSVINVLLRFCERKRRILRSPFEDKKSTQEQVLEFLFLLGALAEFNPKVIASIRFVDQDTFYLFLQQLLEQVLLSSGIRGTLLAELAVNLIEKGKLPISDMKAPPSYALPRLPVVHTVSMANLVFYQMLVHFMCGALKGKAVIDFNSVFKLAVRILPFVQDEDNLVEALRIWGGCLSTHKHYQSVFWLFLFQAFRKKFSNCKLEAQPFPSLAIKFSNLKFNLKALCEERCLTGGEVVNRVKWWCPDSDLPGLVDKYLTNVEQAGPDKGREFWIFILSGDRQGPDGERECEADGKEEPQQRELSPEKYSHILKALQSTSSSIQE